MLVGVSGGVWYSERHGLIRGWGSLLCLSIVLPVIFLWMFFERAVWNHDLREVGISTTHDVWGVKQFPE